VTQLTDAKKSTPPDYASAYEKLKSAIQGISFLLKPTLGQAASVTKPGDFILGMLEESGVNVNSWDDSTRLSSTRANYREGNLTKRLTR
jgi:hypothetical protein